MIMHFRALTADLHSRFSIINHLELGWTFNNCTAASISLLLYNINRCIILRAKEPAIIVNRTRSILFKRALIAKDIDIIYIRPELIEFNTGKRY